MTYPSALRSTWRGAVATGLLLTLAMPAVAQAPPEEPATAPSPALGFDPANFDTSVRPQDDFYQFANGDVAGRTPIPGDRASFGSFDALREQSEAALHELLEEAAAPVATPRGSDLQKVADYYRSHLDRTGSSRWHSARCGRSWTGSPAWPGPGSFLPGPVRPPPAAARADAVRLLRGPGPAAVGPLHRLHQPVRAGAAGAGLLLARRARASSAPGRVRPLHRDAAGGGRSRIRRRPPVRSWIWRRPSRRPTGTGSGTGTGRPPTTS
jgi:hypothetical protein